MPLVVSVVGWSEFQHYRDRDPPWIKLHRKLLDNYAYACLQDASKSHLIGIWLLAARHHNAIPNDAVWIANRIGATTPVDLDVLVAAGFITIAEQTASSALASRKQSDDLETEGETETEREGDAAALLKRSQRGPRKARQRQPEQPVEPETPTRPAAPRSEPTPTPTPGEGGSSASEAIKQITQALPDHVRPVLAGLESETAPEYLPSVVGVLRAARSPVALLSEVGALHSGLRGVHPWGVLGAALHDLAVDGGPVNALRLRVFAEKLARTMETQAAVAATGATQDDTLDAMFTSPTKGR